MPPVHNAKYNMVEQQIRPWLVSNPDVISILHELNRDEFVDEHYKGLAYADCEIPLNQTQRMLKPVIEGRILQALEIKETDSCLVIGTGSGYLTACIANLAQTVHCVEIDEQINQLAAENLSHLSNVTLQNADARACISGTQQYDIIVITASCDEIPENFKKVMTIGGKMFVVTGTGPTMQACKLTRTDTNTWDIDSLFDTSIQALQ